jgi:hypothetical protein
MKVSEICGGVWREQPGPGWEQLTFPLRSSQRLRIAALATGAGSLAYAMELVLKGHWFVAAGLLVSAGLTVWRVRATRARNSSLPVQLTCASDGQLSLVLASGDIESVTLQPRSVRLGSHLLLILRGPKRTHCLLLGPDNLAPSELAALKRRLPTATAVPGTALHSLAASRGRSADPP